MDPSFWQPIAGLLTIQVVEGACLTGAVLAFRSARRARHSRLGAGRVAVWVALGVVLAALALGAIAAFVLYGAVAATLLLWQFGAAACRC